MDSLANIIGNLIRDCRVHKGFTQGELGYLTNLDPMTISRIERGQRLPAVQTLFLIARALGVPFGEFFARIEAAEPEIILQEDPGKSSFRRQSEEDD